MDVVSRLYLLSSGPDPEGALAGGGGSDPQWRPTARALVEVQGHSPWKLLNLKHRYRWNHAILAANQQNFLEKLK